jgi:hypothetical protein
MSFLFVGIWTYRGYQAIYREYFTIYTNQEDYNQFVKQSKTEENLKYVEFTSEGAKDYKFSDVFGKKVVAINYLGTQFLIQFNCEDLNLVLNEECLILHDDKQGTISEIIIRDYDTAAYTQITGFPVEDHILYRLFATQSYTYSIGIRQVVDDYIPNGKWVSKNRLY